MKLRRSHRWAFAIVAIITLGYGSAAVSLPRCNSAIATWIPTGVPAGSTRNVGHADPALLFLPFVARVPFERKGLLAPAPNDEVYFEQGTRFYFTLFGIVFPVWTTSEMGTVVAEAPTPRAELSSA